jgi:hypothetical protein
MEDLRAVRGDLPCRSEIGGPEPDRLLEGVPRVDERRHRLRRDPRVHQGGHRTVPLACGDPVVRELRRRDRHATNFAAPLELGRERGVEPVALAVQELGVCDLAEQGVAEGIATAVLRLDQDPAGHREAQRVGNLGIRRVEHRGERRIVDAATGGRGGAEHLPRPRWNVGERSGQHFAEPGRQAVLRRGAEPRRAGELLDEERVAGRSTHELVPSVAGRRRTKAPEQLARLCRVERPQLEPLDTPVALDLGEELQRGFGLLERVGPNGEHEQRTRAPRVREQELDQVARAGIGPLDVVDDDHDRAVASEPVQDTEECLEQARLPVAVPFGSVVAPLRREVGARPRLELGEQPRQLGSPRPE